MHISFSIRLDCCTPDSVGQLATLTEAGEHDVSCSLHSPPPAAPAAAPSSLLSSYTTQQPPRGDVVVAEAPAVGASVAGSVMEEASTHHLSAGVGAASTPQTANEARIKHPPKHQSYSAASVDTMKSSAFDPNLHNARTKSQDATTRNTYHRKDQATWRGGSGKSSLPKNITNVNYNARTPTLVTKNNSSSSSSNNRSSKGHDDQAPYGEPWRDNICRSESHSSPLEDPNSAEVSAAHPRLDHYTAAIDVRSQALLGPPRRLHNNC